jgi:hypothetical protein
MRKLSEPRPIWKRKFLGYSGDGFPTHRLHIPRHNTSHRILKVHGNRTAPASEPHRIRILLRMLCGSDAVVMRLRCVTTADLMRLYCGYFSFC